MFDPQGFSPKLYHPATFLERGVAVPFTTPLLGGARARPCERKHLELIILNPSGGRGVYILPWTAIANFCRLTLHDVVLSERVKALEIVTPPNIRRVARAIAAEGLAGEDAIEAAKKASQADHGDLVVTNYQLLMILVRDVNPAFSSKALDSGPLTADHAAEARKTVELASKQLNQTTDWTAKALEQLAELMANIGVGATAEMGRMPRLVGQLRVMRQELGDWTMIQLEEDLVAGGQMVCSVADLTLAMAEGTLAKARSLSSNVVGLLRAWASDPENIRQLVSRPEWLLDGWEQVCLVWRHATDDATRRAALMEIVGLVPVLPKEAVQWCENYSHVPDNYTNRRVVPFNEDWLTGSRVYDLIARNELFRSLTC